SLAELLEELAFRAEGNPSCDSRSRDSHWLANRNDFAHDDLVYLLDFAHGECFMTVSHWLRPWIKYAVFWAIIWWILSEGIVYQTWFALIVILTAALASVMIFGNELESALRLRRLTAFVVYFIFQS